MTDILTTLSASLLVPTILFFALGLFAAMVRSDLTVPAGAAKFMSLYLLMSIGFKGGHNLALHGLGVQVLVAIGAGVALSFVLPFIAYGVLGVLTRLDRVNAAAVAGHYGSISIVTFVTAVNLVEQTGLAHDGFMVAVAAAMEIPAIVSALWLANRAGPQMGAGRVPWRDVLANGSVVLLTGAFAIGAITGPAGMQMVQPFFATLFTGILCLFLLDMGLVAGQSLLGSRHLLTRGLFAFGVMMPLVGAALGWGVATLIGLPAGSRFLLMVLSASASYIAVPAAMRIALPQADSGVYLTLALGVTFPFNIALGLPLYLWLAA